MTETELTKIKELIAVSKRALCSLPGPIIFELYLFLSDDEDCPGAMIKVPALFYDEVLRFARHNFKIID